MQEWEQHVLALFKKYDSKKTGSISRSELERVLEYCQVSSHVCKSLLDTIPESCPGEIDYEVFLGWISIGVPDTDQAAHDTQECNSHLQIELAPTELPKIVDEFQDLADGSGCIIERCEERGIMIKQLRKVVGFAASRFGDWQDRDGQPVTTKTINLYNVVTHIIKPATEKRKCSYVELVASGSQPPSWFVSHWWGEVITSFVQCLRQHMVDRALPVTVAYWVCAYANNQWYAGTEIGDDPAKSSFRKAMTLSEGTISILDPDSVVYNRIWCCYEVWVSLCAAYVIAPLEKKYLYDCYTCLDTSKAVGLTDGFAAADMRRVEEFWKDDKYVREKVFPLSLCRSFLSIELQHAQASRAEDKVHILNSIIGKPSSRDPPPDTHERYEELNSMLRGRFAAASWRKALEVGDTTATMEDYRVALLKSRLLSIDLSFDGAKDFMDDRALKTLAAGLPPTLKSLCLDFSRCGLLTDESVPVLASAFPAQLEHLQLDLSDCKKLTDISVVAVASALAHSPLRELRLDFSSCRACTDEGVIFLAKQLPVSLDYLDFFFLGCRQITDKSLTSLASRLPPGLASFGVSFVGCEQVTDEGFGQLLKGLPRDLKDLTLYFNGCLLTDRCAEALLAAELPSLRLCTFGSLASYISPDTKAELHSELSARAGLTTVHIY